LLNRYHASTAEVMLGGAPISLLISQPFTARPPTG